MIGSIIHLLWKRLVSTYYARAIHSCEEVDEGNVPPRQLVPMAHSKALDVGCGKGWLLSFFDEAVGIDVNFGKLKMRKPGTDVILGDAAFLPFRSHNFEVVTFLAVIEHLNNGNDLLALREISRVLRAKGKLFMSAPPFSALRFLDPYMYLGEHHRYYAPKDLIRMLHAAGFSIETIELQNLGLLRTLLWFLTRPSSWLATFTGSRKLMRVLLYITRGDPYTFPGEVRLLAMKDHM